MRKLTHCLALGLLLLHVAPAGAITIEGVEFNDVLVFDIPPGADFTISTSEDLFVFAPNDLLVSDITINAGERIVAAHAIQVIGDTISLCALEVCALGPLDLDQDVVVRVFDPVGDLSLTAGGSVVLSTLPIPEPGTAGLLAFGLAALAFRAPSRRR